MQGHGKVKASFGVALTQLLNGAEGPTRKLVGAKKGLPYSLSAMGRYQ
jgi:hypothetical protein